MIENSFILVKLFQSHDFSSLLQLNFWQNVFNIEKMKTLICKFWLGFATLSLDVGADLQAREICNQLTFIALDFHVGN